MIELAQLHTRYDSCMVGVTVSSCEEARIAYSLTKLTEFEKERFKLNNIEKAREIVAQTMRASLKEHGPNAPVFIDDTLSVEEPPVSIILPNSFRN